MLSLVLLGQKDCHLSTVHIPLRFLPPILHTTAGVPSEEHFRAWFPALLPLITPPSQEPYLSKLLLEGEGEEIRADEALEAELSHNELLVPQPAASVPGIALLGCCRQRSSPGRPP